MAGADAIGRPAGGLPRLRFGLGALRLSRAEGAWAALVLVATVVVGAGFVWLAMARWSAYETNAFDLAFFDQIVWNTSRGHIFGTSFVSYNFAGQHLEPVLLAYVPAYWLGAGPPFLLVSQALLAAAAAIPLYGFARQLRLAPAVAAAASGAYLANPYLHRAIGFDFHPEVMAAGPAFVSAWAIAAGRPKLAITTALSVLLFKEDTVLMVLALSAFMWTRGLHRESKITAGLAVAYAGLAVLLVMPLVRQGHPSDLVDRYGYLLPGSAGDGVLRDAVVLPWRAARVLVAPQQLVTVGLFLTASAPLAIARPIHLIWLLPGIALASLSTHPPQRDFELHYAAELVPVALILGVLGTSRLKERVPAGWLAVGLLGPPLVAVTCMNPLGAARGDDPSAQHKEALVQAIGLVPADWEVSVAAQSGLLPRLSQRQHAYEFPGGADHADWIVLDRYGFRSSQSIDAGFDAQLAGLREHLTLVFSADGVEVFRRRP